MYVISPVFTVMAGSGDLPDPNMATGEGSQHYNNYHEQVHKAMYSGTS